MIVELICLDRNCEPENLEAIIQLLKSGLILQFVLSVGVDIRNEELVFFISIGSDRHSKIDNAAERIQEKNTLPFLTPSRWLGGGMVKIEKNKLIFFESSGSYGEYDTWLLKKHEEEIKKIFRVKSIVYKDGIDKLTNRLKG